MSIIQFKEANCKSCYKCIRTCDVKAISFSNEQARIIPEACILCGKCTLVCPQNAKQVSSDLPIIEGYRKTGAKIYASVAPSYVAAFPGKSFTALSAALKRLGFAHVEETAIGATQVSREYMRLMEEKKMRNIITTCCPTSVMLVEKYYPELVPFIAPVVSPAVAHARMMKKAYGDDIKVVFIGPCISKQQEAKTGRDINAVLMFEELKDWLEKEEICISEPDENPAEMHETVSRLYPSPGGILSTIPRAARGKYKSVAVDGLNRCIQMLDSIRDYNIGGYFIEMSACSGSCVEGPGLKSFETPFLISKDLLLRNSQKKTETPPVPSEETRTDFFAVYNRTMVHDKVPDDETIKEILARIGKTTPESMLNCGACGYPTCREKAIAVYQGKADLKMCLPYMREKAESMSNVILENTPNAIFMLDQEFMVLQYNRAAGRMFDLTEAQTVGMPIELVLPAEDFELVRTTGNPVFNSPREMKNGKLSIEQTIVPVPNGDYLVIARDVTEERENHRKTEEFRRETVEITQKVIDKQMRVAQEIASLLGETTGETKAALTKLKKSIAQGDRL